jgi:hypothetical protein
MPSDQEELAQTLRLAAVAVVSAVVTATAVIGAGQFWIARSAHAVSASVTPSEAPLLVRTAG